jgi:hypothetical protein
VRAPDLAHDVATAALALARRFAGGATMWCYSPRWPHHAHHVTVEFVHPVIGLGRTASLLKGVLKPWECKVFGTACTPERPIGTCMVSSEGACAAYYNYGRLGRELKVRAKP